MSQGMKLGITGGIGSGKSFVCHLLTKHYGIPVYDCDAEAKRLNMESPMLRKALSELVGKKLYNEEGILQRQLLADYLFSSEENAQRINAIVHPVVAKDFQAWATRTIHTTRTPFVAIESAILFESGFDQLVDISVNICAPLELRLQRAMCRDNASRESIERRMNKQLSDEIREKKADFTIFNDGRDLIPQIERIFSEIGNGTNVKNKDNN